MSHRFTLPWCNDGVDPRGLHSCASRCPAILLALIASTGPLALTASAQTDEEVRQAVADCIGLASENDAAREALKGWGDSALPVLQRMAAAPGSAANLHLVVAIGAVGTQGGVDLLFTLVERNDPVHYDHAFDQLRRKASWSPARSLVDLERFERAVVAKVAATRSWLELKNIAETIAELGWTEQEPLLRDLLDHENLEVRRTAAQSIRKLTGELVTIEEPTLAFPRDSRRDDAIELLSSITALPRSRGAVAFVSRGDAIEDQLLLSVSGEETVFLDDRLEVVDDLPIRIEASQCLLVPTETGEEQIVVRASEFQRHSHLCEVLAYDLAGNVRWRYGEDGRGVDSVAPLYHEGEVLGLVFGVGGATGVVALDLGGSVLWTLPRLFVVYEVRTHPGLLGHVGVAGGHVYVVDALGRPLDRPRRGLGALIPDLSFRASPFWAAEPYATHAVIFPDAERRVAGIVAGAGENSVETIARLDHEGRTVWSATVPHDVSGLCLVEASDRRCIAAVTRDSRLVLFDEHGGLIADSQLEGPQGAHRVQDVQAGRLADDLVIALTSLDGTTLYRVKL